MKTTRFIVYLPKEDSYVKFHGGGGGWTSGHKAKDVNSYRSVTSASRKVKMFDSLSQCQIVEVIKTVEIIKHWDVV